MKKEKLEEIIQEALGEVSALFMSQEVKGTKIVMPTEKLERITNQIIEKLQFLISSDKDELLEALIWCSGSADFQEGGKARKGWLKICSPLLKNPLHKKRS